MNITFTLAGIEEAAVPDMLRFSWPGHTVLARVKETIRGEEGLVITLEVPGLEIAL